MSQEPQRLMTLGERLASDLLITSSILNSKDLARASALVGMTYAEIPTNDLQDIRAGLRHLEALLQRCRVAGRTEVLVETQARIGCLSVIAIQRNSVVVLETPRPQAA